MKTARFPGPGNQESCPLSWFHDRVECQVDLIYDLLATSLRALTHKTGSRVIIGINIFLFSD